LISEKPPKLKTFLSNFLKISVRGVGVLQNNVTAATTNVERIIRQPLH
jgi:uncharacterized protein (TIGR03067 family)